jgi:hypothetical protein
MRRVVSALKELPTTDHAQPFSRHLSLPTRHCRIQSLAKHNRKPMQLIENKEQQRVSIASFFVFFTRTALHSKPWDTAAAAH